MLKTVSNDFSSLIHSNDIFVGETIIFEILRRLETLRVCHAVLKYKINLGRLEII